MKPPIQDGQLLKSRTESGSALIGIITRNRASILPKAIDSALRQDYRQIHVCVLDDGSTDGTPGLQCHYPSIQWTRWEVSRGYLEGRNYLMNRTSADYYVSLDDDAWFLAGDEVRNAIQYLDSNPKVAAIAFDILSPKHSESRPRSTPGPTHLFVGCGHILRLSALQECGLYEPSPGAYGFEEIDLCLRLLDCGWEIHFLPGVHVWHEKTNIARDLPDQYRSSVCNDLTFAARRCPFPLALAVVPLKLTNHFRFSLANQLLKSFVRGVGLFLCRSGDIWAGRKAVRTRVYYEFISRSRSRHLG
jgi:GT2 family glycosyltransferase